MNPDLRNLIALQDLELKIAVIQKQIADTPVKIQALREELQRLNDTHSQRVARAQELTRQRRTLESEVELMRTKLSKLKDQLMSVKTNKEYTAMLHEIQMAEERIRSEEDKILDIMEEMETKERDLKSMEAQLKASTASIDGEIARCEAAVPGLEVGLARLQAEKLSMESSIESDLLARYRRIAEARRGIALAEAKDELCSACHVRIRPQVYADLLRTEDILACDSCSRILFSREAL